MRYFLAGWSFLRCPNRWSAVTVHIEIQWSLPLSYINLPPSPPSAQHHHQLLMRNCSALPTGETVNLLHTFHFYRHLRNVKFISKCAKNGKSVETRRRKKNMTWYSTILSPAGPYKAVSSESVCTGRAVAVFGTDDCNSMARRAGGRVIRQAGYSVLPPPSHPARDTRPCRHPCKDDNIFFCGEEIGDSGLLHRRGEYHQTVTEHALYVDILV